MSASHGRLSPFLPASDDHGVDLLVMNKAMSGTIGIQVKSWRADRGASRKTVQFDIRKATFFDTSRVLLAALVLNPAELTLEIGWLVPMSRVPSISVERENKYALAPSRSPTSKDRYAPFRHLDVTSMVEMIEGAISDVEGLGPDG